MLNLLAPEIDQYRVRTHQVMRHYESHGNETCGVFRVPLTGGILLGVIASAGEGWDHVSVSHAARCPTWDEMEYIKKLFLGDAVAMQLHVPAADHVNIHPFCLHLWSPTEGPAIPLPPPFMVG